MEKDVILQVEGLSKQYRLGVIGTGTISHDLNRWWCKIRGKEDPYQKIGEKNERTKVGSSQYVWALRDVSFEVKKGEVLGIIGKNGAGKSTLLKLLSKVTTPTKGVIRSKGRIASLLEVGTGFHPELTGKENIFLNGAILGMTKAEIKSKFDEIVDFAGVQRYVNTPVKRYSSGMKVRLAFAVAAYLEPEILVVDEVLAVGDAEFQKKAIGKMKDISSGDGRTVLFVSHNMSAIKRLCTRCILLEDGQMVASGSVESIMTRYLDTATEKLKQQWNSGEEPCSKDNTVKVTKIEVVPKYVDEYKTLDVRTPLDLVMNFENTGSKRRINLSYHLYDSEDILILNIGTPVVEIDNGIYKGSFSIPGNFLNNKTYRVGIYVVENQSKSILNIENALNFKVEDYRGDLNWYNEWRGMIRPTEFDTTLEKI